MSKKFIDKYCFQNNELVQVSPELFLIPDKLSAYEVIRVIGGIPLFIEDHFERLQNTLSSISLSSERLTLQNLKNKIASLCEANNKFFGNVELIVALRQDDTIRSFCGFVPHAYPEPTAYLEGVSVDLISAERENPNAKIKDTITRLKADNYLSNKSCFEVLLSNDINCVTEGSRSNFFYIINNEIFTAPTNTVLPGITRKYVIEAIKKSGFNYIEKLLPNDQIKNIDTAFLSGTSLGILPINKIGNQLIDVKNTRLRQLMLVYNDLVKEYLENFS